MPRLFFSWIVLSALVAPSVFAQPFLASAGKPTEKTTTETLANPIAAPGLLVMAHGGTAEWNDAVEAAVAPLRGRYPVEIAFGMADPHTLGQALSALDARGVEQVAVVRLFMDGGSFLHQTEYFLGLRPDPPAQFLLHGSGSAGGHGNHHGSDHTNGHGSSTPTPAPLTHDLNIALSQDGLMQASEVADILAARAATLSKSPAQEAVLVLAHGTGDEVENARWIVAMEQLSGPLRALGFHSVRVETLREDWPDRRADAERRIRAFVEAESQGGRTVLVVPFRLFGFGPYHDVLDGLPFRAADTGLLPHDAITDWLDAEYRALAAREGWPVPAL